MPQDVGFFDKLAIRRGKKSLEAEIREEEMEAAEANDEAAREPVTDVKGTLFVLFHVIFNIHIQYSTSINATLKQ